jgi:4-amino-4-deoxy-L-arabinose transferase-like glycosyltransferase
LVGGLLIGAAAASSLLIAAATRFPSLVSTLLTAYLAFVANLALATLVLSPTREVTRSGLAVVEVLFLALSLSLWQVRGRPGLSLGRVRAGARELARDPVVLLFLGFIAVLLGYQLVLGLGMPPNNGDALGYHLPRAAAWAEHGGIYWIPNAPTVRMNAFQPLAEEQILFLIVATGGAALVAMPQLVAELGILVAVYGAARRLGFDLRRSTAAALLLAMFSLLALESTTAQNDLVVASFAAVAACLLLAGGRLEATLAGAAIGIGLGAKLTILLVTPALVALALLQGRRTFAAALAGALVGFLAIGMWGYVLNAAQTGHVLAVGTGYVEDRASPSYPGSVANAVYLLYGLMDVSVLSKRLIDTLAILAPVAALAAGMWRFRRGRPTAALGDAAGAAVPFLAPLLVLGGAACIAFVADRWGFPLRGPEGVLQPLNDNLSEIYTHISNEDYSAFGPVGIVSLILAIALTIVAVARRRADLRHLALALTPPLFLVLIAMSTFWSPFLVRFFLLPAVVSAPLLAHLFRSTVVTAAYLLVAAVAITLTVTRDQTKPLTNPYGLGRPWNLTQPEALDMNSLDGFATALVDYDRLVPPRACVGAVLGTSDPSYLLYGPSLQHRVVYLPAADPVVGALRAGVFYVVIDPLEERYVPAAFQAAGWRVQALGSWALASDSREGGDAASACS